LERLYFRLGELKTLDYLQARGLNLSSNETPCEASSPVSPQLPQSQSLSFAQVQAEFPYLARA
jgi:hypothetical protein